MQDGKLGVMQIIGDLEIGGAQQVVHTLVKYLAADGCRPVVCTLRDGPLHPDIGQLSIETRRHRRRTRWYTLSQKNSLGGCP